MVRSLLIYLPPVLLMVAAIIFPQMGRDVLGRMNARELSLFIAFWWMIVAVSVRIVRSLSHSSSPGKRDSRGFDAPQNDREE